MKATDPVRHMTAPSVKAGMSAKAGAPIDQAMHEAAQLGATGPRPTRRHREATFLWYVLAVVVTALFLAALLSIGPSGFGIAASYAPAAEHLTVGALLTVTILAGQKLAGIVINKRTPDDNVTFFNLRLVVRLVALVLICLVLLSAISQTWYTVPVALGMFTIVAGFALQMPMTSFIGWVYILARRPYRVGDRIKVAGATGDVIDISYFDTTLWEFGGQYLSTDHPSGRVIKFPNSTVLNTPVFNYSWALFPYIWDEIRLYVAYNSDLDFVSGVMIAAAGEEVGDLMAERVRAFRSVLDKTPVDQLDVREEPTFFVRVNEDGWLDAIVRYLVDPKEAGRVKTSILRKMLLNLNAEPDRVLFPKWR